MPDRSLADYIRDKLAAGQLPREQPGKARIRSGSDRLCLGCDARIWPVQLEYELEMEGGRRYWLHVGCHGVWVTERHRRRWESAYLGGEPSNRQKG